MFQAKNSVGMQKHPWFSLFCWIMDGVLIKLAMWNVLLCHGGTPHTVIDEYRQLSCGNGKVMCDHHPRLDLLAIYWKSKSSRTQVAVKFFNWKWFRSAFILLELYFTVILHTGQRAPPRQLSIYHNFKYLLSKIFKLIKVKVKISSNNNN